VIFWLEGTEDEWFGGFPVEVGEGGDGGVYPFPFRFLWRFMFEWDDLVVLVVELNETMSDGP
jgi:hypothetical protein